jgi:hypothetical protein
LIRRIRKGADCRGWHLFYLFSAPADSKESTRHTADLSGIPKLVKMYSGGMETAIDYPMNPHLSQSLSSFYQTEHQISIVQ